MARTSHSYLEREEFVAEIFHAYRCGEKLDHDSLFQRAFELWPCSHRISIFSISKNVKCEDEEIRKQILTDEEFLDSTYTSRIYWNYDEAIVGKDAVAAGLVEVLAYSIESSADLLAAAEMLRSLFEGSTLPFESGDYSNEYEDQPGHWVCFVKRMNPDEAMIYLFYKRICSIEDDEVWSPERKDFEFKKLTNILEEYERAIYGDFPVG
jgi:hypothetical protein